MEPVAFITGTVNEIIVTTTRIETAGEKITGPYSIREERADYIPYKLQDDMLGGEMAMGDTATPITPDTVTVRAAVVAEFTFR